MVEYIAQHLRQTSREATVLLYSPDMDPHLEKIAELADRVFCFYKMPKAPAKSRAKAEVKMPGSQATLEASRDVFMTSNFLLGEVKMSRSFESVRKGAKDASARWPRQPAWGRLPDWLEFDFQKQ
jgi:hypothetical protein